MRGKGKLPKGGTLTTWKKIPYKKINILRVGLAKTPGGSPVRVVGNCQNQMKAARRVELCYIKREIRKLALGGRCDRWYFLGSCLQSRGRGKKGKPRKARENRRGFRMVGHTEKESTITNGVYCVSTVSMTKKRKEEGAQKNHKAWRASPMMGIHRSLWGLSVTKEKKKLTIMMGERTLGSDNRGGTTWEM